MDNSFWLILSLIFNGILILCIIVSEYVNKQNKKYNKTLQHDKATLERANQELNANIIDLISQRDKLRKKQEEQNDIIHPTIYIEKPIVDILEFKAKLPYYDKEDEKEVSEQLREIIFQNFKRDMLQYVEWTEDYDYYENQKLIRARLRIIKPREV